MQYKRITSKILYHLSFYMRKKHRNWEEIKNILNDWPKESKWNFVYSWIGHEKYLKQNTVELKQKYILNYPCTKNSMIY